MSLTISSYLSIIQPLNVIRLFTSITLLYNVFRTRELNIKEEGSEITVNTQVGIVWGNSYISGDLRVTNNQLKFVAGCLQITAYVAVA